MYMAQLPTYTDVARHAFYQTRFFLNPTYVRGDGGGALCFEWGFTWTFPGNQDVAVK